MGVATIAARGDRHITQHLFDVGSTASKRRSVTLLTFDASAHQATPATTVWTGDCSAWALSILGCTVFSKHCLVVCTVIRPPCWVRAAAFKKGFSLLEEKIPPTLAHTAAAVRLQPFVRKRAAPWFDGAGRRALSQRPQSERTARQVVGSRCAHGMERRLGPSGPCAGGGRSFRGTLCQRRH